MKLWIIFAWSISALVAARAQLFTPEGLTGAAMGGVVGGLIGHNSGRQTAEGIAIGAGGGFLLGTLAHQARGQGESVSSPYDPNYANAGYYNPNWYYGPVVYGEQRPSYA